MPIAGGRSSLLWRPERVSAVERVCQVQLTPYQGHKVLLVVDLYMNQATSEHNRLCRGPLRVGILSGSSDGTSFAAHNQDKWDLEKFRATATIN